MVKKTEFSDIEKAKALAWRDENIGPSEIARRIGRSKGGIQGLFYNIKTVGAAKL